LCHIYEASALRRPCQRPLVNTNQPRSRLLRDPQGGPMLNQVLAQCFRCWQRVVPEKLNDGRHVRISGCEVFASQLNTQDAVTRNWAATSFCISFSSKASAESDPRSFLPRRNLEQSATAVGLRKYDRHRFVRLIEAEHHGDVGLLHSVSFDRFFTNAGNQHLDD
jgi:hypothetical protein